MRSLDKCRNIAIICHEKSTVAQIRLPHHVMYTIYVNKLVEEKYNNTDSDSRKSTCYCNV